MDIVIYKLTCLVNGMGYVGMTKKLKRRMNEHRHGSNYKSRCHVDRAIKKYGWENFHAEVIEICDAEIAPKREMYWIATLKTKTPNGYNMTDGGEGTKGHVQPPEHRLNKAIALRKKSVFPVLQAELDKRLITRTDLAQRINYNFKAVSSWFNGKREISLSMAIKIKEVLGVDMPLEELFAKEPAQQSE
ncbi:MAG: GIY-YIG nuclease family protein [Selenomonadaceae bacterium]|nr:GIY-YIG nuclease family protein [Selenomonadaceae bacterium]